MRRVVFVSAMVVVAALSIAPSTTAVADAAPCERGTPREKGEAAVPRLGYPWPALGYSVEFLPGRAGLLGMTYPDERRIEVYVRDCQSVASVASVFGHEVGHAVDVTFNDAGRRQEWQEIRGFRADWHACSGCPDYRSGSGDFAEVFSYLKSSGGRFRSQAAGPPSPDQAVQLERFFHAAPALQPAPPRPGGILDLLSLFQLVPR